MWWTLSLIENDVTAVSVYCIQNISLAKKISSCREQVLFSLAGMPSNT